MKKSILTAALVLLVASTGRGAEQAVETSITGQTLSINKQATRLGAAQWAQPERSWRTVGELIKSAMPPANKQGQRPHVVLQVALDEKAPWGAAKALFMAASSLGISKAKVKLPKKDGKEGTLVLSLPGADPKKGQVVNFPLSAGEAGKVLTENGGRKVACTTGVMKGLVKQLPKATVNVTPDNKMSAAQAIKVLDALINEAKAAGVAYMPIVELSVKDTEDRKKTEDALDRAFGGGALGGK